MPAGRPTTGPAIVEGFEGSPLAKQRLRAILETLSGETSIVAACDELDVGEARFHELRREALEACLERLELRKPGRKPRQAPPPSAGEVERLEARVRELEAQLAVTEARAALAATMPSTLRQAEPLAKKGGLPRTGS